MFLNKLRLENDVSYRTSTEKDELIENMLLSFDHIPVITPYSTKSVNEDQIQNFLKERGEVYLTIPLFLKYKEYFDATHALLEEYENFRSFGYKIEELTVPFIALKCFDPSLKKLNLFKLHIKADKYEKFISLFIISKIYNIAVICKETEMVEAFCGIFNIDCKILDNKADSYDLEEECAIVFDKVKEIKCERILFIGSPSFNLKTINIDFKEVGKYKYRIEDAVKFLHSGYFRRHKNIPQNFFENIIDK